MFNQFSQTENRSHLLIEIIGWAGLLLIVGAYLLVSFAAINSNQGLYQIMNLLGAVGIIIHSASRKDYQPMILNIVWAAIAILALLSLLN